MLTLRQMEIFIAVCDLQSISKASEALYMTQQGVSKSIRDMENELHVPLLVRTAHGVRPNEYGAYVLEESRQMLSKTYAMVTYVDQMRRSGAQSFWLGASFGVLSTLPAQLHKDFFEENPHVNLIYTDGPDIDIEKRLVGGDFDAAIILGPTDDLNLVTRPLFSERVFLYVPEGNSLFGREHVTMQELFGQSFMMFQESFRIAQHFVSSFRYAGMEPVIELRSADFNNLRELARQRNALFIAPEHTLNKDDSSFCYIPFPDPSLRWTAYYAIRRNKVITNAMLSLENILNRYFPPEGFAQPMHRTERI